MLYLYDIPEKLNVKSIAIDTESMGLSIHKDRLCLVQLCDESGKTYLIHFKEPIFDNSPNLVSLLSDEKIIKIFHYGRFDIAMLMNSFNIFIKNVFCTKIASRIARSYTNKHGLKDVCKELLNIELNKDEQTSYWGNTTLTKSQCDYARNDVIHLHAIKDKLFDMIIREKRYDLLKACLDFLPYRAHMDIIGGESFDVFPYKC